MKKGKGFTLIELLIVIAIILILIAIALPNFLEAQIRAKVARAKGEMRTIDTAMLAYFLDFKIYPEDNERHSDGGLYWLTSPIKYIGELPADPFVAFDNGSVAANPFGLNTFELGGLEADATYPQCPECLVTWVLHSSGPDGDEEPFDQNDPHYGGNNRTYTPTNGTKSNGNFLVWGGDSGYIGVRMTNARPELRGSPALATPVLLDNEFYYRRMPPNR
jgi:prepilin-type N-terminal cleavage/methylation domain-containing protein